MEVGMWAAAQSCSSTIDPVVKVDVRINDGGQEFFLTVRLSSGREPSVVWKSSTAGKSERWREEAEEKAINEARLFSRCGY
jgi:hypothetical protein